MNLLGAIKLIPLRHKIGQMLIMGFAGCDIEPQSPVVKWLTEDSLGGVLLFDFDMSTKTYGKNLRNCNQIKRLIHQLKHYAESSSANKERLPPFIAIDYEGGAVDRLSKIDDCMTTMSAFHQGLLSDHALYLEAEKMAVTLKELGFNLNFAPVVDLNLDKNRGIIGKLNRSFSSSPEDVIRAARQFVNAFSHQGIACSYKHFPGHGSATGDTHEGFVDVTEYYQESELAPYERLLSDKKSPVMVMTAHVINRRLDNSGLPATLSYPILTGLLRQKIGFDGVIISDDLQMQAISDHYKLDEALSLTLNAGADMVIFGNQLGHNTPIEIIDCIEGLVSKGIVAGDRIDEAYQRICRLKININESVFSKV